LISDYYHKIGIVDEAGDVKISYRDYWNDLIRVSYGNLVKEDNARTAVVMYGELLSQIISKTLEFKDAGVEKAELEEQIFQIERHLQEDFFSISQSMRSSVEKDIFSLKEMTGKAKKMVASVYDSVE
jgi:serine/threonine-protein kinase